MAEEEINDWIEERRKGSDLMCKLLNRNKKLEKENKICEEIIIGEQQEINDLQKENAELKEQNKSLIETLCAIATDTNEHITHNVAQNELDKWS